MDSEIIEDDIDGCIHSIHVKNFFCHDNLEVNLNRNVNFIVGRNGSGKSAILTALVVGLGGRASATNRGNNLHSFIKKGQNSATIEIKIKNNSAKAFKHNVYGDHITIVRNINASGGSNYKVKSSSGEVISTKYEEVNAIILAHDIQVDNPISVLNQDDARSFHASDAKKKYSLFRKATNLDQTETNYVRALENCNKATAIWNKKSDACVELEKEYKKWKTSHEQLQSRDEIEIQKQALQNEYYWSEIADFEKEANTIQTQYDRQKAKMEKLVEKLNNMEKNFGSNTDAIQALKDQLKERSEEKSAFEQELRRLEAEVREMQSSWRNAQNSIGKQKELLNREKRKVVDLEREIQNIESGSGESVRGALEAAARAAAAAASGAAARYDTAQHDAAQARHNLAHAQGSADQAHARAASHRDTIKQLRQQLRELESRGSDSLAVYGNNMVELCQRIKKASKQFSAPPRGPVGSYLKVKEKKWGGALEHIIGGSLQAFCVNTPEDSRKLFEIMGQVYGRSAKPGVTCSKFLDRLHSVSGRSARCGGARSALDSLLLDDPVVGNFLIDTLALETILLVPDHEDAIRLASNEENVPEKCSRIVTLDGTEYHPAPNYRSYGGAARPSRYLQVSTAERKRQVQAEIQEAESTLKALEATAEELNHEAQQARDTERAASKALQALLAERHEKAEAAKAAAQALEQHETPHHAVLVEELNISKEKVRSLQEQVDAFTKKDQGFRKRIEEYDSQMKSVKTQLGEATTACRSLSEEIEQEQMKLDQGVTERRDWQQRVREDRIKLTQVEAILEEKREIINRKVEEALTLKLLRKYKLFREEIEQEQMKLDQGVTERRDWQQRVREDRIKLTQVEAILEEKREIINRKVEEALTLCPRIERPRDKMIVTNELKKTQLKLSSIRSDGLSKAQVAETLLVVERKYRRTKLTLDRLKLLIDDIKSTTDKHLNFCHRVQTYIARRVQYCFQSILNLRGYSGRMDIDNARGCLELVCSGRETGAKRRAASTSSLSGGERSYSTVAFIMALWDCVELPFYFMDEFDVFMDNVNRKIVMELLIDHALKNTNRQFVFLTPQDASSVTAQPQISIHLMADPRP